jgi:DNA-binding transcriptional ArsR family regulator
VEKSPSLCGINCYLCEQYLSKGCKVCINEESKKDCEALNCVLEIMKVEDCLECHRATYCKKRRRSMDACLVFRPRRELAQGTSYVLSGPWGEGMSTFAKHIFMGKRGLLFTPKDPSAIVREFMLEGVKIYKLVPGNVGGGDIHFRDLDGIRKAFGERINKTDIVLLDGLYALIEANTLQKAVELVRWMNEKVLSRPATLLITTENLTENQKNMIKQVIRDSRVREVIKSVSNPKRMEILSYLRQVGKAVFTDIYEKLGYSVPPKLSFHLRVLKDSGVIEQDDEGVYYISDLGRGIAEIIGKIGAKIEKEEIPYRAPLEVKPSKGWAEKYGWYILQMKRVDPPSADVLGDVKNSLQLIFGERKTQEIFQIILMDYIETEKRMSKEDLKRMISEIAFVFLVEVIPLVEAIEWADELLKKHDLK